MKKSIKNILVIAFASFIAAAVLFICASITIFANAENEGGRGQFVGYNISTGQTTYYDVEGGEDFVEADGGDDVNMQQTGEDASFEPFE